MKAKKIRGDNRVKMTLYERTYKRKADAIQNYKGNATKNIKTKDIEKIYVTLKVGYSKSTKRRYLERYDVELPDYFFQTYSMPKELGYTPKSVQNWVAEEVRAYNDTYQDVIDENPQNYENFNLVYNVREVYIRYVKKGEDIYKDD